MAAGLLLGAVLFAEKPASVFNWSLLWSGSWEENSSSGSTLHNRGEFKLNYLPAGLTFRGQVLDRRKLSIDIDTLEWDTFLLNDLWEEPENQITNYLGGLYHKPTGSRFLIGVLDEYGLPARIRNPWIRSPPYTENHRPVMADLKTTASSTKKDEAYLYLSSPVLNLFPNIKLRGFASAQTEIGSLTGNSAAGNHTATAFAGGVDFIFPNKKNLLMEFFYTGKTLPPRKSSTWFSAKPPLPEREFHLYSAGILYSSPLFSVSSDLALSETFAWGKDIYANLGFTLTPLLPSGFLGASGRIPRPLSISAAIDGAGGRFIYRDGADYGAGFRTAAKIELKGSYNSLFRINTVLRSPGINEDFNRSSTGIYYRFPSRSSGSFPVRLTRVSLTADRNAVNPKKISDGLSGYIGFSINLQKIGIKSPLGINISGSIKGLSSSETSPSPYPVSEQWDFDTSAISCEFVWSPSIYQFRSKTGYSNNSKNNEKWDFSFSAAARFKYGRLSLRAVSPDFPEKWRFSVSWRMETD